MLARSRTLFALLGFSLTLLLGACDDQDDESDPTDETEDEGTTTSGGW
ncbi:hypothetical protein ACNOYE_17160 [Nannocystaceae bacterium ST9]